MNSPLNEDEILDLIREAGISKNLFALGEFDTPEGVGAWEEVKQYGGEGKGDTWFSVKYFKDHDVYIRTEGWYSSYSGVEFDNYGRGVRPANRTVTFYE